MLTPLSLRCQYSGPWTWWWRPALDECFRMLTPTISTPSQSTVIVRHTCLQMTCASTCGTWRSTIAALVSFCSLTPCHHHLLWHNNIIVNILSIFNYLSNGRKALHLQEYLLYWEMPPISLNLFFCVCTVWYSVVYNPTHSTCPPLFSQIGHSRIVSPATTRKQCFCLAMFSQKTNNPLQTNNDFVVICWCKQ